MNRYLSNLAGTLLSTFRVNNATVDASSLTAARTYTLPDATGTVALTSNIPTDVRDQTDYSQSFLLMG